MVTDRANLELNVGGGGSPLLSFSYKSALILLSTVGNAPPPLDPPLATDGIEDGVDTGTAFSHFAIQCLNAIYAWFITTSDTYL